jgi:ABC-type glycerol-3-phosphate transport system substrate-binding protein
LEKKSHPVPVLVKWSLAITSLSEKKNQMEPLFRWTGMHVYGPWLYIHEVGNVPYVVDNGAGVFSKDPREAARQVARWFTTHTNELRRYSLNALKLAQPEAVFDIVKDIHKLQQQPATVTRIPYSLTSSFSYSI